MKILDFMKIISIVKNAKKFVKQQEDAKKKAQDFIGKVNTVRSAFQHLIESLDILLYRLRNVFEASKGVESDN